MSDHERKKLKTHDEHMLEFCKDPEFAAEYLNAALLDDSEDTDELFLLALRRVAQANGFSTIARKAGVNRESLYKSLSGKRKPQISTITSILEALGCRLSIQTSN